MIALLLFLSMQTGGYIPETLGSAGGGPSTCTPPSDIRLIMNGEGNWDGSTYTIDSVEEYSAGDTTAVETGSVTVSTSGNPFGSYGNFFEFNPGDSLQMDLASFDIVDETKGCIFMSIERTSTTAATGTHSGFIGLEGLDSQFVFRGNVFTTNQFSFRLQDKDNTDPDTWLNTLNNSFLNGDELWVGIAYDWTTGASACNFELWWSDNGAAWAQKEALNSRTCSSLLTGSGVTLEIGCWGTSCHDISVDNIWISDRPDRCANVSWDTGSAVDTFESEIKQNGKDLCSEW